MHKIISEWMRSKNRILRSQVKDGVQFSKSFQKLIIFLYQFHYFMLKIIYIFKNNEKTQYFVNLLTWSKNDLKEISQYYWNEIHAIKYQMRLRQLKNMKCLSCQMYYEILLYMTSQSSLMYRIYLMSQKISWHYMIEMLNVLHWNVHYRLH